MMIYKYQFGICEKQDIEMFHSAQILSVQLQNGIPCLWAMVDPSKEKATLCLSLYGTGHEMERMSPSNHYLGTLQMPSGLVWHVFGEWNLWTLL